MFKNNVIWELDLIVNEILIKIELIIDDFIMICFLWKIFCLKKKSYL